MRGVPSVCFVRCGFVLSVHRLLMHLPSCVIVSSCLRWPVARFSIIPCRSWSDPAVFVPYHVYRSCSSAASALYWLRCHRAPFAPSSTRARYVVQAKRWNMWCVQSVVLPMLCNVFVLPALPSGLLGPTRSSLRSPLQPCIGLAPLAHPPLQRHRFFLLACCLALPFACSAYAMPSFLLCLRSFAAHHFHVRHCLPLRAVFPPRGAALL